MTSKLTFITFLMWYKSYLTKIRQLVIILNINKRKKWKKLSFLTHCVMSYIFFLKIKFFMVNFLWLIMQKKKKNWCMMSPFIDSLNECLKLQFQSKTYMLRIFQNHCILTFQPNQCSFKIQISVKVQCFVFSILWPSHSNSLPLSHAHTQLKQYKNLRNNQWFDQLGDFSPLIQLSE